MRNVLVIGGTIVLLAGLAVAATFDRGRTHPLGALFNLSPGAWASAPLSRGPGSPPPGFTRLRLSIEEPLWPEQTSYFHSGLVYARGTVEWDGVAWPMTLELRDGHVHCRYAAGHPFHASADPDGFEFEVHVPDAPFEGLRSLDRMFVNHDVVTPYAPERSYERSWYTYERHGD